MFCVGNGRCSILAERKAERESSYPYYAIVLNLQNIEFSMTVNQITKFELLNDISNNVYGIENENIVSICLIEQKRDKHVHLLWKTQCRMFRMDQEFISICELATVSKKDHRKHLQSICIYLMKYYIFSFKNIKKSIISIYF